MSRIFMSRAHVTEVEESLVLEALRSGWVAPLGPMVDRFEREVAERVGVSHALALSSGTAALHLALLHHGARPGMVVVLPSMTFAATANAVLYTGAEPVLVDSVAHDANVDCELLLEAVDDQQRRGREVVAALSVDLFGRCADNALLEVELRDRGVALIEDAAEALGASRGGRAAGSFGSVAALSFNGNKIMTTSGGGMLLSDDSALIERARYLSTQARQPAPWYEHTEMGFNYRMSNVLAGLGVGQLSRLDEMIATRRRHRERYIAGMAGMPGVRFLSGSGSHADSADNCWLTAIVLDPSQQPAGVNELIEHLDSGDIEARHLWKPMHLQPMYAGATIYGGDVSADLFSTGLTLPSGSELSEHDIDRVLERLRDRMQIV